MFLMPAPGWCCWGNTGGTKDCSWTGSVCAAKTGGDATAKAPTHLINGALVRMDLVAGFVGDQISRVMDSQVNKHPYDYSLTVEGL